MILGLDVSTSIVGICLITEDNRKFFWYINLSKTKDHMDKVSKFHDEFTDLFETVLLGSVDHIFIEDKLSGFKAGKTMQQTIVKLAFFNGAVSCIVQSLFGMNPVYIHPSTAKATMKRDGLIIPKGADKKKLTVEFVKKNISEFPYEETRNGNPKAHCHDMADAYLIARAGYLKYIK